PRHQPRNRHASWRCAGGREGGELRMSVVKEPVLHEITSVRLAGGRVRDDLRAIRVVWKREFIRFSRSRTRILTSLAQPVIFLFILGTGLSSVVPNVPGAANYRTFMFPGVLAMTVLFTAMFSAISIVWDRE